MDRFAGPGFGGHLLCTGFELTQELVVQAGRAVAEGRREAAGADADAGRAAAAQC